MDELKISSSFMRGIISRIARSTVKKKLGYNADIQINELNVSANDEKVQVRLSFDATMSVEEFKKITKILDSQEKQPL